MEIVDFSRFYYFCCREILVVSMKDFIWTIVIVLLLSPSLAYLYQQPKTLGKKVVLILLVSLLIIFLSFVLDAYTFLDLRRLSALLVLMPITLLLLMRIARELDKQKK